jgi:hypothetical protein
MTRCLPISSCSECPHKVWEGYRMRFLCDHPLHPHVLATEKSKINLLKEVSEHCPLDEIRTTKGLPPPTEGQKFRMI